MASSGMLRRVALVRCRKDQMSFHGTYLHNTRDWDCAVTGLRNKQETEHERTTNGATEAITRS
jgi:hypothetical protein